MILILIFQVITILALIFLMLKLDKILNAQDKSRSVTLHEEDGNKCPKCNSSNLEHFWNEKDALCIDCGWAFMKSSDGSMPHEG